LAAAFDEIRVSCQETVYSCIEKADFDTVAEAETAGGEAALPPAVNGSLGDIESFCKFLHGPDFLTSGIGIEQQAGGYILDELKQILSPLASFLGACIGLKQPHTGNSVVDEVERINSVVNEFIDE